MTRRAALALSALCAVTLAGCNSDPGRRADPASVSGTLTGPDGKPMKNVTLLFTPDFPEGASAGAKVGADGKFTVQIIPGPYLYYLDAASADGKGGKGLEKYTSPSVGRKVTVAAGGSLDVKLD